MRAFAIGRERLLAVAATLCLGTATLAQWVTPAVTAPGVQYRTFESAAAGQTVSFHVWLPPEYASQPARQFPLLIWLHGSGDGTLGIPWMSNYFGTAMAQGAIPPMIILFPNGMPYSMWCDSKNGAVPMERVVIDDLLPFVDANYRTIGGRHRILEGFSMGGHGTGRLGFRRTDLFAGLSMLGAGPLQDDFLEAPLGSDISPVKRAMIYQNVWGNDAAYYTLQHPKTVITQQAAAVIGRRTVVRQALGSLDTLVPMNQDFDAFLSSLGVPHTLTVAPGIGHSASDLLPALGFGQWAFYNAALAEACRPLTDVDGSGVVDAGDVSLLLLDFGMTGSSADLDGDGVVSAGDQSMVLLDFGNACDA
ncbi:MAG: alpha/beta hydrolase-fold protein [Phycisphaerales bacterium]